MTRTWPSCVDHDVVGLEVAVDEPGVVRRRQAAPRREEYAQHLAPVARRSAFSQ